MMGLVFGLAYPRKAAQQMLDVFVSNLRLLSQLVVHPSIQADPEGLVKLNDLREQIANNFCMKKLAFSHSATGHLHRSHNAVCGGRAVAVH
jgi:hypothetical protein